MLKTGIRNSAPINTDLRPCSVLGVFPDACLYVCLKMLEQTRPIYVSRPDSGGPVLKECSVFYRKYFLAGENTYYLSRESSKNVRNSH